MVDNCLMKNILCNVRAFLKLESKMSIRGSYIEINMYIQCNV